MNFIDRVKKTLEKIKKEDKTINSFLIINSDALKEAEMIEKKIKSGKAGRLAGKIIAIKSNINVKGLIASSASKTLENYTSTYDATVIKKIDVKFDNPVYLDDILIHTGKITSITDNGDSGLIEFEYVVEKSSGERSSYGSALLSL